MHLQQLKHVSRVKCSTQCHICGSSKVLCSSANLANYNKCLDSVYMDTAVGLHSDFAVFTNETVETTASK